MSKEKTKIRPRISIIIPVKDQPDKTISCFQSIRMCTATPYELIWIDNASLTSNFSRIRYQATRPRVKCKLIKNPTNVGFVQATNQGIAEARGEYCILLNNDTEVTPGWERKLLKPLLHDKGIGAVGPLTDSNIAWQGINNVERRWGLGIPKYGKDPTAYSQLLEKQFGAKYIEVGGRKLPLSFFCCCIPRSLFKKIGVLDETLGIGMGDDDDIALRMKACGYKQVLSLSCFVKHHHRTTFNALKIPVDSIRRNSINVLKKNSKIYKDLLDQVKEGKITRTEFEAKLRDRP